VNVAAVAVELATFVALTNHNVVAYLGSPTGEDPVGDPAPEAAFQLNIDNGALLLSAESDNRAEVLQFSLSVAGVSVNVADPVAHAGGATLAHLGGNFIISADSVTAKADSNNTAITAGLAFDIAAIGISVEEKSARTTHATEASVSPRANLSMAGIPLFLDSDSINTATIAQVTPIDVSAIDISVVQSTADAGGSTTAYVDEGAHIVASLLDVRADSGNNATVAKMDVVLSAIDIEVSSPTARTTHVTEAFVGPAVGVASVFEKGSVNGGADTINVGRMLKGFSDGDAVVYRSFGAQAIGGLTDGNTYYVDVDASDLGAMRVKLFNSRSDALANTGVINVSTEAATGPNHSLTKVESPVETAATDITLDGNLEIRATSVNDAAILDVELTMAAISINTFTSEVLTAGATRAYVGGLFNVDADGVLGEANSTNTPKKEGYSLSITAIGVTVNNSRIETHHDTEAFVSRAADFDLDGGIVDLNATSTNDAQFEKFNFTLSAIPIDVFRPEVEAGGTTRAFVVEGAELESGGLSLDAASTNTASLSMAQITISAVSVDSIEPVIHTTHVTQAHIGPAAGVAPDGGLVGAINVGGGLITVTAISHENTAEMGSINIDFGVIPINVVLPEVIAEGSTKSHLGGTFTLTAGSVAVTASAPVNSATTETFSLSVGVVPIASDETVVTADHTTEAFVAANADLTVAGGPLALTANSSSAAEASSMNVTIGAVNINDLAARATVGGATRAFVGDGADVAAGNVSLVASSTGNTATANQISVNVGLVGVDNLNPLATTGHTTAAFTGAGSSVNTNGGTLMIDATSVQTAISQSGGVGISAINSTSIEPTAHAGGDTSSRVDGTVETGELLLHATATTNADADAFVLSISLGGGADSDSVATVDGATTAVLGSSAMVTATGNIVVQATSTGEALSVSEGGSGGVITGAGLTSHANNSRATRAFVDGGVIDEAGNVTFQAISTITGSARTTTGSGGAFASASADAQSNVTPAVEASIRDNSIVNANNTVRLEATSVRAEADAKANAASGGLGAMAAANPTATSSPTVTAFVGAGATVLALEDVLVLATATAVGEPGFGDTFDAANVDLAADTITFQEHGLISGDMVVYGSNGSPIGTPAGNLANDREFTIIRVDNDQLSFGAPFPSCEAGGADDACTGDEDSLFDPAAGIDSERDIIRFAVPHRFRDGDAVRYDPQSGGLINAALNETDTYYVRVVDDFTIKLAFTQAAALVAPTDFGAGSVNGALDFLTLAGFSNDQAVTYRAPKSEKFQTEGIDGGAETILIKTRDQDLNFVGHGLSTGDRVQYFQETGPNIGVGNGAIRYVIRVDDFLIKLSDTYAHALAGTDIVDLTRAGDDDNFHVLVRATIGLENAKTYYVVNSGGFGANTFQLSASQGGAALGLTASEVTGTHTLGVEGMELVPAAGTQSLFINFTATGGNGQTLFGPNDVSLRTIAPPPGNGISESSGSGGSGGGFAGGHPAGKTIINHNVSSYVAATLVKAGRDVTINSISSANGSAYASNGSGGFIQVGAADAFLEFHNTNLGYIGVDAGGGTFDATGVYIQSGRLVSVHATSSLNGTVSSNADGGGFISDSDAESHLDVDGATRAITGGAADVHADALSVLARYSHIDVEMTSDATSGGLFGGAEATTSGTVDPDTQVLVQGSNATLTGLEGVDLRALAENINVSESSDGTCYCIGDSDSNTDVNVDTDTDVIAASGATLTVGPRVFAGAGIPTEDETVGIGGAGNALQDPGGFPHLALFARADGTEGDNQIDWNSDLVVLSGPVPRLHVNSNGDIVKAINVTINGGQNAVGSSVGVSSFSVDNIANEDPGEVLFQAGAITGAGSTWDFRDSFDLVKILNESSRTMTVNNIDVINRTVQPFVDLQSPGAPSLTYDVVRSVAPTLVEIDNTFSNTVFINGTIENPIGTTSIVDLSSDVLATNDRDVADGVGRFSLIRTNVLHIETPAGGVGTGSTRVNVDVVDAANLPTASTFRTVRASGVTNSIFLGRHQFFTGELVQYTTGGAAIGGLTSGNYYKVIVSLDGETIQLAEMTSPHTPISLDPGASTATTEHDITPVQRFTVISPEDIWLDVKGRLRDPGVVPASDYRIIIDAVDAGDDIDILLQASVNETGGAGNSAGILVKWPGSAPADGQTYVNFFKPDAGTAPRDLGVFGTSPGTPIESTFDVRAVDANGLRTLPGAVSDNNIIIKAAHFAPTDTLIHIFGITEILGTGFAEGPADQHHIEILTNGDITINEITDDLRIQSIVSTANDVLLYAPLRIVDALDDAAGGGVDPSGRVGTDVAGENITLCAGTGLVLNGTIANPLCSDVNRLVGGIGRSGNFLETNVDILPSGGGAALGVLRAFDITVEEAQTLGIFISETVGNLNVHTVHSVRDVALNTLPNSGSIVDARNGGAGDDDPDVLGNNIDLDAAGGSVGNPAGTNDLEIDSFRGAFCILTDTGITLSATCDVGIEAYASIYVTETNAALNLALAHAHDNIRLTVRESADLDEHLNLLRTGEVVFFEDAPDSPRLVPNGAVYAETGFVLLRVGDNVTLDPNSRTMAGLDIDIFGDDANADLNPSTANVDPHFGTNMILRGRIIAGCVFVSSTDCAPFTGNPVQTTEIWGHTDVDTIQFGDPSGQDLFGGPDLSVPGSDGYIFIGSRTIARGSENLDSGGDDGEDEFRVWYLQSANVVAAPAQLDTGNGAGHSLTLDGQADTDYYTTYTTGSHGAVRNYVVNVLDTGAADDGVDELTIYGYDNLDADHNGYVTGTLTRNKTDDIFLLRAVKCIDTIAPYGVTDTAIAVPTSCDSPTETADQPAFVALLHGDDTQPDGGLGGYRSRLVGDEASNLVQRINYDAALNGRMSIYGLGGNDYFGVDDNSAITTLDGGAGYDVFQVGQIFGQKRDGEEGGLLPQDTFPVLIATTRGWLSPGTHAPLVATGGTGNDEFTVYSNQSELRLEGDDENDLFVVRAFALAAVCDTSADNVAGCDFADINLEADRVTGLYPVDSLGPDGQPAVEDGICDNDENPGYDGEGWSTDVGYFRRDNNGDGVCNKADAQMTGAKTNTAPADPTKWEDDIIPLDADGVARPIIGLGFSTARPLDIRAGGGEDEVSYNINSPVSVDGGTGFDKLAVLGTEFADDMVISVRGILGAGLNVRYENIEIVEVDGLEGDDEFFVQSTKFGVAYRVIGGLGSDTINVTGDVTEDIVTRELEGVSGTIDHRVSSDLDVLYDGLPVDGLDYNLATPFSGQVIIADEGDEGTSVREGGSLSVGSIDWYSIQLASDPTSNVYVTVSAARSPQEEADDAFSNPEPTATSNSLTDGQADTIWLCTGPAPGGSPALPSAACDEPRDFKRYKWVNGLYVDERNRALVLTYTGGVAGSWDDKQWVYVYAVDEVLEVLPNFPGAFHDQRSEGDRVVVIQHSTISSNSDFDALAVRNVEVSVRDNDTPGVYVTQITPGSCAVKCEEDQRGIVVEGDYFDVLVDKQPHADDPNIPGLPHAGDVYTGRTDEMLVQLQQDPGLAMVRVKLVLDAESQQAIQLSATDALGRWHQWSYDETDVADPLLWFTYYTIDFDTTNWNIPVIVKLNARPDGRPEDPQNAVIRFLRDDNNVFQIVTNADGTVDVAASELDLGQTFDPGETYVFPNLRSGTGLTSIEVIDDETADLLSIESGTGTLVQKCGDTFCTVPGNSDDYTVRLTKQPEKLNDDDHATEPVQVDVAILTDGLADVTEIDGVAVDPLVDYSKIGGLVPARLFLGNLSISLDGLTVTRANGSEQGSFLDEGFQPGDFIRVQVDGVGSADLHISSAAGSVTDDALTLDTSLPAGFSGHLTLDKSDTISFLTRDGVWTGDVSFDHPIDQGWQVVRADNSSWLADGFLEGQWVEVCVSDVAGNCVGLTGRYKIAIVRGENKTKDEKLEFRRRDDALPSPHFFEDDLSTFGAGAKVTVTRLAAVVHFDDDNWFLEQKIVLTADVNYNVPISRQGVKVFPVSTHKLSKLRGPLAVEGGVTGADRSLKLGLKLPGEKDGPLFAIGIQPPESKQIDVLNIFNDGSQQDRTGTTTSTTLSGLGLPKDLDFGPSYSSGNPQTFGEPAIFPGGIGYGSIQFVDGKFDTNGAKSTVEVVNLLLGTGNDNLDIQGTLDPDVPVKLTGTIVITPTANGIDLTRPLPFDWKAQGFLVGQPVHISGFVDQTWTVLGFSDDDLTDTQDNTRLHLSGPILTPAQIEAAPLDVFLTQTVDDVTIAGGASGGSLTRAAGDWIADGFIVGQSIQLVGVSGTWRLSQIINGNQTIVLDDGPAMAGAAAGAQTVNSVVRTVIAEDVPVTVIVPITIVGGEFGGAVTRTDSGTWTADKFLPGQLVMIGGIEGAWRLRAISLDGKTLTLERGAILPTIALAEARQVFWPGPHGGLTVVHGGGNTSLRIRFEMDTTADSVTRLDGLSWTEAGFVLGQKVIVEGAGSETRTIVDFVDGSCPFVDPFPGCGLNSTMVLSGDPLPVSNFVKRAIHVAEPDRIETTALMNITVQAAALGGLPTSTLTCAAGNCFDGTTLSGTKFLPGMQVWVSGQAGPWTIDSVTANTMVLSGAALRPTYQIVDDMIVFTPIELTVFGYDVNFDGGVRMGGDRITVCNQANLDDLCGGPDGSEKIAGPDSPLVVYGDTSQDGVWYGGQPSNIKGYEFGPKPFDPFYKIPDQENEDDEWVFPLANPFDFGGNDIIDASGLFASLSPHMLPSVGFTAYGGVGDDLIIGSQAGDHLAGGSGDDTILGLRGTDHLYGDSGVNVNILTRGLTISTENSTPAPTLDNRNPAGDQTIKPGPSLNADPLDAGRDLIYGEGAFSYYVDGETLRTPQTILGGPQTAYDDVIFGDHGEVLQQVADTNQPDLRLQKVQTTTLASIRGIESRATQNGGDDAIFGNLGRDVIIAGAGHDLADGDEADDSLYGDNAFLTRRVVEPAFPTTTDYAGPFDITSPRYQALCGTLLYSRTDLPNTCSFGNPVGSDNSGQLLVNGVWQNYRDPDSGNLPGDIDLAPWWSEYLVNFDDDFSDEDEFHSFDVQLSVTDPADPNAKGLGSFGNDYLAGGQGHDLLFGQMGNDVLQGDGGGELAFGGTSHVGASRSPDGCTGVAGVNLVCDYVGDLDVVPSLEAATDGEDYLEGNGGDDILVGNLGQDDIVGGSSDFFSLSAANHAATGGADLRPDGSDLVFGGAGTRIGRNEDSSLGSADADHNRDADTIVADNGRIVRIVGTGGVDGQSVTAPNKYVTFNYDNHGPQRLVVSGVTLIDYTPGGPDFQPELFFDPGTPGVCSGAPASGECSPRLEGTYGISRYVDIGGRDEVHAEAGDDTVYAGAGGDTIFGDAQDDNLIGGWGDDWISGGTGRDGVIGDDGRLFTSRNAAGDITQFSEPLFGVNFFLAVDPDLKKIQGNVLNEFIYTPGQVQTATINVGGDLKKQVDITPYNLGPNVVAGHFQIDLPLFDANNSDDVIFGGWDDDFLHGAAGDDAIAGGEALPGAFTQHFGVSSATPLGLIRSDWTRPWNPGDMLHFGADTNPWHANHNVAVRLGEFLLYDEYDPRRAILLADSGAVAKTADGFHWFLNFDHGDGRDTAPGCVSLAPNGTCLAMAVVKSDGNDKMFGDLGNDWVVGGTGRDDIYAGWGNDLSNADDVMTAAGPGVFGDGKPRKIQPSPNDTPDTHPTYEDRVYGGAGLDVLIGNTGGDRLIDWVGEWNSYIVPFAPFGIATVSRQVNPFLPEFLYALSASDGADATRDTDTGRPAERNGEFEGELGLITQADHGYWQQQTGGPSDPQPGNVPGGRRDVLRSADFNDGLLSAVAVDSGVWQVASGKLSVAAASLGQDAAAVLYADGYLPVYYEVTADISTQKPTGGWKANAYVVFDYFTPTDFKFAGIDVSTNKLVVGHRTPQAWQLDTWGAVPGSVRADTTYQLSLVVNGSTVTVKLNNKTLTHTFAPRIIDGVSYGLNKGLVGAGSDNARGTWDNFVVQILPPTLTMDLVEDFNDNQAQQFTGNQTGTWTTTGGRYASTAAAAVTSIDTLDLGVGHGLDPASHLELLATLKTNATGGLLFDEYATNDFKFVALDVAAQKVLVGHMEPRRGWVVDTSVSKTLTANTDYAVQLVIKGTSVSVTVGGVFVVSHAYQGAVVDGAIGVLTRGGTTSFDRYQVRTNDSAFSGGGEGEGAPAPNSPAFSTIVNPLDVSVDGFVSPIDALLVINYLNALASTSNGEATPTDSAEAALLDINGDGYVSPLDALLVINHLNAGVPDQPEGEAADNYFTALGQMQPAEEDFWQLLAVDTFAKRIRRR